METNHHYLYYMPIKRKIPNDSGILGPNEIIFFDNSQNYTQSTLVDLQQAITMKLSAPTLKFLLVTVSFASIIVLFFCKPIVQDENFHHFADIRRIFSVANCWNVISNLAFLLVGITALQKLRSNKLALVAQIKAAYYIFFTGVLLVAFGSSWYHYNPNNTTMAWDRLPMTIAL